MKMAFSTSSILDGFTRHSDPELPAEPFYRFAKVALQRFPGPETFLRFDAFFEVPRYEASSYFEHIEPFRQATNRELKETANILVMNSVREFAERQFSIDAATTSIEYLELSEQTKPGMILNIPAKHVSSAGVKIWLLQDERIHPGTAGGCNAS